MAHPGARATRRLISARFVWAGLSTDINKWTRDCLNCQKSKILRHIKIAPEQMEIPPRRFSHIHVDIVGPLPISHGFTHLFTVIDRSTRWPEAIPITATSATDCAAALFQGWIARFGVPTTITSDRGTQFTSSLWAALCALLNIRHSPTTAFHPQSNGMVERLHRRLKEALRARLAGPQWVAHLPWVLLGLRTAPREDSATSAAEYVYGTQLVLPGRFLNTPEANSEKFFQELQKTMKEFKPIPARHNIAAGSALPVQIPQELKQCKYVLVRKGGHLPPLTPLYEGPYRVISVYPCQ